MPNPGKPRALKLLNGSRRVDDSGPSVELPLVQAYPDPPEWLPNAHAVKEWHRVVPLLMNVRLLTEASLTAVGHMCAVHGRITQEYAANMTPTGSLLSILRNYQNDFGLTAMAQQKIRPPGELPAGNKFTSNGRKPKAK
ncbi:hypothetical protein [Pandoraea sputorum]|uniref:hypothetical protein n=1 Tax=Pandoraea sputorum TaxID=93222 RepID=UPI00123F34E7|nr:hypothetical protein [Pandoraea sputorum]VVE49876.1 terminase [Pandoraea sputorum]